MEKMCPPPAYGNDTFENKVPHGQFSPSATAPPLGPQYNLIPTYSPVAAPNINHFEMPSPPVPTVHSTSVSINTNTGPGPGCPICHNNGWTGTYSCCAWCLAIFASQLASCSAYACGIRSVPNVDSNCRKVPMDEHIEKRQPPPPYSEQGFCNPGYPNQYPQHTEPRTSLPPEIVYGSHPSAPGFVPPPGIYQPVTQQPAVSTTRVEVHGATTHPGCPVCHNNSWTGTYSCCAWLWAICCFPCGIICCCCMRRKKCTKCGFTVAG